jgi:hypothetical protein
VGVSPCHCGCAMHGWPGTRVRTLLLALLLALGTNLAFVQGNLTAAEMAVSAEAAHPGPSGCDGCSGGHDCETDAGTCLSVCGSAAQGMLPGEPAALPPTSRASFEAVGLVPGGHSNRPEHGPPKLITLG